MENGNVEAIGIKLGEQIERTEHLIRMLPSDSLDWDPRLSQGSTDVGHLLGHLLDCLAGFCAAFYAAFPEPLAHFVEMRSLPVNHFCTAEEALNRFAVYRRHIAEAFCRCTDDDLLRMVPSVFVPEGEPLITILLGNLEHLINHKYQLFFYLKLLGVPVTSRDIYHWRGAPVKDD